MKTEQKRKVMKTLAYSPSFVVAGKKLIKGNGHRLDHVRFRGDKLVRDTKPDANRGMVWMRANPFA